PKHSSGRFVGLPRNFLGTDYIGMVYADAVPPPPNTEGSFFTVVATKDGTTVRVTPAVTTGSHPKDRPYTVRLHQGQTYQLINRAGGDLTGTFVTSDEPVALFGGFECAYIAPLAGCEHLVEEIPPTRSWGQNFVTLPQINPRYSEGLRFLAATDGTIVLVNGVQISRGGVPVILQRGQYYEMPITRPVQITANNPILVAQFAVG